MKHKKIIVLLVIFVGGFRLAKSQNNSNINMQGTTKTIEDENIVNDEVIIRSDVETNEFKEDKN